MVHESEINFMPYKSIESGRLTDGHKRLLIGRLTVAAFGISDIPVQFS